MCVCVKPAKEKGLHYNKISPKKVRWAGQLVYNWIEKYSLEVVNFCEVSKKWLEKCTSTSNE